MKKFKFNSEVKNVIYNKETDSFTIYWNENKADFDFVIVATGHFSVPNIPKFKGQGLR